MRDRDAKIRKARELAAGSFRCSAGATQLPGAGSGLRKLAVRLGLRALALMDEVRREQAFDAPSPTSV
jgi:hypothetical protein